MVEGHARQARGLKLRSLDRRVGSFKTFTIVFKLANQPGILGKIAKKLGEANVNIDYIYGSAMEDAKESIFVVHIAEEDLHLIGDSFKDL